MSLRVPSPLRPVAPGGQPGVSSWMPSSASASSCLDDDSMWPASYALTELTAAGEARIAELVRRAVR